MHESTIRSAIHATEESVRADAPRRVRRVVAARLAVPSDRAAASLFGSAGGRIRRSTSPPVEVRAAPPARLSVTAADGSGTIRRKGGDRERDRRKGREKQRRTQERDRKERGEDRTGEAEEREQAANEAEERVDDAQKWEDDRLQRRNTQAGRRRAGLRARQRESDEAERRQAEEQAAAEEEERQEPERERQAEQQRQAAERRRREDEERKRQEAAAAAERERIEEEARRREKEAQDKAEAERQRLENATSTDFEPENVTPDQFEDRCKRLFDQARAQGVGYTAAETEMKLAVKVARGGNPPRTTMYGPRAQAARVELRKLRAALATPRVDPLAAARSTAIDRAETTTPSAEAIPTGAKGSPEAELRRRLLKEAEVLAKAASQPHMTATQHDISSLQKDADDLHDRIAQALVDLPLFPVMHGAAATRQADLGALRAELSDAQITILMPLVNNIAVADQTSLLLDLAIVSKAAPTIGVAALAALLAAPTCQVGQLGSAIVLAGRMALAPPACLANLTVLQTVASTFARHELVWFANLSAPALTALDGQFGARLVTFCRAITRARYDHMIHHNVPVATMDHHFTLDPAFLMDWGVNDEMWAHITKIYLNPNTGQISGGHDKAQFDVFYGNLLVDGWTEATAINRAARPSPAGTELVTYDLRTPGGAPYSGTKTLITGLQANPAVWKPLIDNAAWNAMATGHIGVLYWTGSDGTDNWTGIYTGTSIDTVYLT